MNELRRSGLSRYDSAQKAYIAGSLDGQPLHTSIGGDAEITARGLEHRQVAALEGEDAGSLASLAINGGVNGTPSGCEGQRTAPCPSVCRAWSCLARDRLTQLVVDEDQILRLFLEVFYVVLRQTHIALLTGKPDKDFAIRSYTP